MGLFIFTLAYLAIAGLRLPFFNPGRTGAAMLGAAAMVAARVLTPTQALAAVDGDTLVLLFGMMVLSGFLTEAGFFSASAQWVLRRARTPRALLTLLIVVSGALSALLVNDTVCLMLTPLVLAIVERAELPPAPYLLALCMGANAGSAATFTGNPQNMLIGMASGQPWGAFFVAMLLPAALSLAAVWVVLSVAFRVELAPRALAVPTEAQRIDRPLITLCLLALAAIVTAFLLGYSMAFSAFIGAAAVVLLSRRDPRHVIERVDYGLLVFFSCLFVLVQGVNHEGWAEAMRSLFEPLMQGGRTRSMLGFSALSLIASNLFSNVPFVMLARTWVPTLADPQLGWRVLALASTLAGNLTLIGSVANVIVFEQAREKVQFSFWQYLRVGVPATLLSLVLGVGALLITAQ